MRGCDKRKEVVLRMSKILGRIVLVTIIVVVMVIEMMTMMVMVVGVLIKW